VVTLANPLPVASGGSGGTTSTGTGANVLGTTPSFTSTIGVGGATASASGAGITFPATQSASTDANTLDDYEEGTWTPSVSYSSPGTLSVTFNEQYGYYTKVGRQVTVVGMVVISTFSKGTASGSLLITGLPFTTASLTRNQAHGCLSQYAAPTSTTAGAFPALGTTVGSSAMDISYFNNSGSGFVVDPANGSQYFFTLTYFAS
jgi:hypothetical protein